MGSWSYLAANRTPNPNYFLDWNFKYNDIQIIMAAKYAIPPLWHSVFYESDLSICTLRLDDGESLSHPIYITAAEIGIQRATFRRSKFCGLFPENIEPIYDKWLELLKLFNGCYIHMDWSDVADMGDDKEVKEMNLGVQAGIRAFESNLVNDWEACFRPSNMDFDKAKKQATLNLRPKHSSDSIEGDLYGYHFVRKPNKKGKLEWKAEFEEEVSQSKKWWKLWSK